MQRPEEEDRRAGAVLTIVSAVLAVVVALFVIVAGISAYKTSKVEKRWAETLGTWDEVLERYPPAEANAAALELERRTARLGIDTATRSYEDRARPSVERKRAFKEGLSGDMATYSRRLFELPRREPTPPPAGVAAFFETHAEDLSTIRRLLVEGGVPRWEMHIERMAQAPLPNLLGHIDLQKTLICDALIGASAGDRDRALGDLEAAWTLMQSLSDSPFLIGQLIVIAEARMLAGALRQIEDVPAVWHERLAQQDFRRSFTNALKFEGWFWTQFDGASDLTAVSGIARQLLDTVAKPYVKYCLADVSGEFHERLANLDGVPAICDYDLSLHQADLNVPVPSWNVIGDLVVPNLGGALDRLARLELELELTSRVLDLSAARRAHGGRGSGSSTGSQLSSACPRDRWVYQFATDGAMTIAFSREIGWSDLRGHRLPLRFTVTP